MAAPSSPGSYVGEHQSGYFWNGTSWELGATAEELFQRQAAASSSTAAPAAPSTAFGGTIINQQNAKPAPASASAPAVSTPASRRASILSTIMRIESGGRNIPQKIDDINMRRGDPAQGYYQIIGGTWREFGGDKTGHKSALDAPYSVQLQIAQNIPVARWGPATQEALKRAGYEPQPGETLGQMLARYNEDPAGTRPEDVGGSSDGSTAVAAAAPSPNAGLLAPSTPIDTTAAQAAVDKARLEKEQDAANADLTKSGLGLLEKATPRVQPVAPAPMDWAVPQVKPPPLPNFTKQAQATDPFTQVLMQQRLQRRI